MGDTVLKTSGYRIRDSFAQFAEMSHRAFAKGREVFVRFVRMTPAVSDHDRDEVAYRIVSEAATAQRRKSGAGSGPEQSPITSNWSIADQDVAGVVLAWNWPGAPE